LLTIPCTNSAPSVLVTKCRLLTGAGNGIGLAAVENMLSNGARVVAVDLKTEKLSSLKAHHDRQLEIITGDISERRTSVLAIETAVAKFQRLDCIVLNAGVLAPIGLVAETDVLAWKKLFDVNFFALLHTVCHSWLSVL
jgi:NADP-dependent 3-hydroxy acid dehydrogenase YdfG